MENSDVENIAYQQIAGYCNIQWEKVATLTWYTMFKWTKYLPWVFNFVNFWSGMEWMQDSKIANISSELFNLIHKNFLLTINSCYMA